METAVKRPPQLTKLPAPKPVQQRSVTWKVLTPTTLPTKDENWVYFGVTPRQYENIAQNQAELLRYIREAKGLINKYEEASK